MASQSDSPEHAATAEPSEGGAQIQIVGQYIKDLSFENPSVDPDFEKTEEAPNLEVQVNVSANRIRDGVYESAIELKAVAAISTGTIYDLELVYGGMFRAKNIDEQNLEAFLLIHCPGLLFPFARRLVADLTREGGFPPLLLDPIDFAALYQMNKQRQGAGNGNGKPQLMN
jgi:preprotein translocase subunit SecB